MVNVFSSKSNHRYENQTKLNIVRKVVENSHIEYKKNEDDVAIEDKHLSLNLFLTDEFKNRFDRMASILQQVLETPHIIEEYLGDSEKKRFLPDDSIKNLDFLRKWCKTEFKRESDFKIYQALVKETVDELYKHESYFLNISSRAAYCGEIRKKLEELPKKLTDSKYICMVYSSSHDFFLQRQEGTPTLSEIDDECASRLMSIDVDVKTSVVIKSKSVSPPEPPPPPPPLQIDFQNKIKTKTKIEIIDDYSASSHSATISLSDAVLSKFDNFKSKREQRAKEKNMSESELIVSEVENSARKTYAPLEYFTAIQKESERKQKIRAEKNVFKELEEKQAAARSRKFKTNNETGKENEVISSDVTPFAKFYEIQRRKAAGISESSSSDEEWSDHNKSVGPLTCNESSPQDVSEETSRDECEITQEIRALSL